jgi:hypothetical protein
MSDTTAGISNIMLENIRATITAHPEAALRPVKNMQGYFIAETNLGDTHGGASYLFPVYIDEKEVHVYLRI